AGKQQIAGFQEVAMFRQLLDRISAVKQYAFVSVDISDLGLAARGGSEARIVSEHTALAVKLRNVDDMGTDCSRIDRHVPIIVADRECAGRILGAGFGVHGRALELTASRPPPALPPRPTS